MKQHQPILFSWDHFSQLVVQNKELTGLYGGVCIVANLAIGYIAIIADQFNAIPGPIVMVQLALHLALGFLNISILKKKLSPLDPQLHESFLYSAFLSIAIFAALLIAFLIAGVSQAPVLAVTGGACFLFPFVTRQTRFFFSNIPGKEYKAWYMPETFTPPAVAITPIRTAIRFKLPVKYYDIEKEFFPIAISEKIKLGKAFQQLVTEHNARAGNKKIECIDTKHETYGWLFYTEQFGGLVKKYFDANETLAQNNIKNDTVIIVTRVKK